MVANELIWGVKVIKIFFLITTAAGKQYKAQILMRQQKPCNYMCLHRNHQAQVFLCAQHAVSVLFLVKCLSNRTFSLAAYHMPKHCTEFNKTMRKHCTKLSTALIFSSDSCQGDTLVDYPALF